VGDFNGDGLLDVAGVNGINFDQNIRMSLGLPGGTFRSTFDARFRVSSGSNASNYVAADFNGDGSSTSPGFALSIMESAMAGSARSAMPPISRTC